MKTKLKLKSYYSMIQGVSNSCDEHTLFNVMLYIFELALFNETRLWVAPCFVIYFEIYKKIAKYISR